MNFTKMRTFLDSLEHDYKIPGADVIVYHKDQCIFRHMAGYRDDKRTEPMQGNEMFFLYSASKLFTCCAAMILIGEGKLSLDTLAETYYPAFRNLKVKTPNGIQPAQNKLTLKMLLTMTGGLNYDLDTEPLLKLKSMEQHGNIMEEVMNALAAETLDFEPGTHYQYSLCHDIIGAMIEKASGMTFGSFLKERIFKPCGMTDTYFSVDEQDNPRFMTQYFRETDGTIRQIPKSNPFSLFKGYESGGAGLVSTVEDYGKFISMLANDGISLTGVQVMSSESIKLLRTPALSPQCHEEFIKQQPCHTYCLGVRILTQAKELGTLAPNGIFGWDGAAGAFTFIDPSSGIALFYMQHVLNCGPAYGSIHPTLRNLLYECLILD